MKPMKLSPAMQRLVNALNQHGHIDPVRDLGRGTTSGTITALVTRGILREQAPRRFGRVHFPATTPDQVWTEAHDEYSRRKAEVDAYAADPTNWVQAHPDGDADAHTRQTRDGRTVLIVRVTFGYWHIYIGDGVKFSAHGDWAEVRAAADRAERNRAHDGVTDAENAAFDVQDDRDDADTRGQYMSDDKLRGLIRRYGVGPASLAHTDRDELLTLVRAHCLIERTWDDEHAAAAGRAMIEQAVETLGVDLDSTERTRDDEEYPPLTAEQAHPYALLEYAERDYLTGRYPFSADVFEGILINLAGVLLTETERRMWMSDRHTKLWRQAAICEVFECDRRANQHHGCGITAG
jgi:hypothetical protein